VFCDPFGWRGPQHLAPVWYEAVMWVAMSAAEREEFLAGVHVGVLSAAVNAPHLIALVRAGARFERGALVERHDQQGRAA